MSQYFDHFHKIDLGNGHLSLADNYLCISGCLNDSVNQNSDHEITDHEITIISVSRVLYKVPVLFILLAAVINATFAEFEKAGLIIVASVVSKTGMLVSVLHLMRFSCHSRSLKVDFDT